MFKWLKSRFTPPEPAGPPKTLRVFSLDEATIAQDCVFRQRDCWRLEADQPRTVRLFDVPISNVEQCMVTYQAELRSGGLDGRAYLEMWCCFPGRGEFFSKGLQQPVSGTTDWSRYEIPFYLKQGEKPDLIKLSLVVDGVGTVWMRNIELLQTPLAS